LGYYRLRDVIATDECTVTRVMVAGERFFAMLVKSGRPIHIPNTQSMAKPSA
jgi:hypothetical protein